MKVLVCSPGYHPDVRGGGEISTRLLCLGLKSAGMDVAVLAAHREASEDIVDGIPVYRIKSPNLYWSFDSHLSSGPQRAVWHLREAYDWRNSEATEAILRKVRPDVLHTSGIEDHSPRLWKLARNLGIPVIHTLRSYTLLCPSATLRKNERNCATACLSCRAMSLPKRLLSGNVNAVIGISRYILERHLEAGFFHGAIQQVISNISEDEPDPVSAEPRHGPLVLGYLGRLSPEKGVDRLIEALRQMARGLRPTLLVGGWGASDYESRLREKAAGLPVTFLGKTKPAALFSRIDLLVVPSLWHEPLGRIILEANSRGIPVLAAKRGGIPEVVREGTNGWLFDPDDVPGLSDQIGGLSRYPERVRALRAGCLEISEDNSSDTITRQHLAIYAQVTGKPWRETALPAGPLVA